LKLLLNGSIADTTSIPAFKNVKFRNPKSDQERKREKNIKMKTPENINIEDLAVELMKTMTKGSLMGPHMRGSEKEDLSAYREWLDSIPDDSPDSAIHTQHLTAFNLMINVAERIALRAEIAKSLYLESLKSENQEL